MNTQELVEALTPPPPEVPKKRSQIIAYLIVTLGAATMVAGIAFIFWPAALIVGGVSAAALASTLIEVAEPPKKTE